tara:strand:+ start:166 stop:414 length:249 start_codon:yes stop_codon:yes gene_type:complete
MGDVNGKCKACKETTTAMGNVQVWDPPELAKNVGNTDKVVYKGEIKNLMGLKIKDLVVDIKKLKRKNSFKIESQVGSAGIRG